MKKWKIIMGLVLGIIIIASIATYNANAVKTYGYTDNYSEFKNSAKAEEFIEPEQIITESEEPEAEEPEAEEPEAEEPEAEEPEAEEPEAEESHAALSNPNSSAETTPAPAATTPAPAETTPAPAETTPAPAETTPAPAATTPAETTPATPTPAPAETTPAATVPQTTECQHNWVAQTSTINHPEEGEYREVMTMGGYYNPITVVREQCHVCMKVDIYNAGITATGRFICPYCGVSGSYGDVIYEIGQEYVEPIYRTKWVVTKEAWTETITTYTCSICGATK